MKKSNIIIITLSVLIAASVLIFYINGKHYEKKDDISKEYETIMLPEFSVIVAEEDADVRIYQSDTIKLKIEIPSDSASKADNYSIANDTLHIYKGNIVYVYNRNTTSILTKKASWIRVQIEKCDSLNLDINDTPDVNFNFHGSKSDFGKITLIAKNSDDINFSGNINAGTFDCNLTNSEMSIQDGNYKKINLYLNDKSHFRMIRNNMLEDLVVKKDTTSTIRFYN